MLLVAGLGITIVTMVEYPPFHEPGDKAEDTGLLREVRFEADCEREVLFVATYPFTSAKERFPGNKCGCTHTKGALRKLGCWSERRLSPSQA